ncbi:MAG: hypothetical protein H7138_26885, partial [Myxococcales bacterium]|nr:hypothetical protein [Myxococcales bacterium]
MAGMMQARWLVVALSGGVFVSVATPRSAEACGPVPCTQAKLAGAGAVPVNFPGVFWRPLIDNAHPDRSPDPAQISLTRAGDPDTRLPFMATRTGSSDFLLVPDSALTVGETYVATDPTVCEAYGPSGSQAAHIQFVVGPSAPMPTTLGTLAVSDLAVGQRSVPGAFSRCDVEVTAAWQTVQLTLAPEAVPWKSLLQLEVSVDDQSFTPSRYEDHSADTQVTIYHTCAGADPSADSGVASGSHVVHMRGTIAGTTMTVASATATINLVCDATGGGGSGGGPDSGDPGSADGA